jgi:hypothetical protein
MATVTIHINTSNTDSPLGTSGVEWTQFSPGNDLIIFSNGSTQVDDGQPSPSQSELIQAGVVLTGSEIVVPRYFLYDASANELKEIFLMGNQDSQYVMAFDFDDATASEPVFEVWDDDNLNTIASTLLGEDSPTQSMVRGITTTSASSGTNWTGSRLAGSASGHFLYLNDENGPLTAADTLYANLKVIIPASQTIGFSALPSFVVKFLSA